MASNKDIKIDVNIKDQVKVFRDSFDKHKNDISDGFESAEIERKLDRIEKLLSKSSLTHKEMSSIEKLASSLRASLSKVVSNSAPQKLKDLEEKRIEAEEKREKASKIIARSPVTLKSIREGKFKASSELGKIGGASRFYAMMNDENLGDDWKTLADGRRLTDDSEGRKFFARITKNYENFDVFGKYKDLVEAKFRSYDKGGSGYFEMQRNVHKALKDYTEANASIADYNKQYEELGKKEKNSEDLINEVKELNAAADKILDEISNKKDEQKEEEIKQDPSIKLQDKKTGNGLNTAIKKFAVYGVALKAIKAALREAVNTVKELDKSLTEQAMVTGLTRKQTYGLISSYQALALETGATTKEIAEVSTEYMKQGKTVAEAQVLTKAAVSAAKVARVSVGDSVNYLTTALNGFRLSADQAMLVSDKFAAVAAASATDYDELAIALSKVASQANLAGMSIDYTTALLTKGLETTRKQIAA